MDQGITVAKIWVELMQGIQTEKGLEDGILEAVLRQDIQVREAASSLPFETEPATFTRALERIADKVTPK